MWILWSMCLLLELTASTVKTESDSSEPNSEKSDNMYDLVDSDASSNTSVTKADEEFDSSLPETVTLLKHQNGSKVYLVGTAHFSRESQEDVSWVCIAVDDLKYIVLQ